MIKKMYASNLEAIKALQYFQLNCKNLNFLIFGHFPGCLIRHKSFCGTFFLLLYLWVIEVMSVGSEMHKCKQWNGRSNVRNYLFISVFFIFSVTCNLRLGNPVNSVYHFGTTDNRVDTTDSAQWVDLHCRSFWWPEFDGLSLLSCSEMENSVEQHIYDQTVPHYTATP